MPLTRPLSRYTLWKGVRLFKHAYHCVVVQATRRHRYQVCLFGLRSKNIAKDYQHEKNVRGSRFENYLRKLLKYLNRLKVQLLESRFLKAVLVCEGGEGEEEAEATFETVFGITSSKEL